MSRLRPGGALLPRSHDGPQCGWQISVGEVAEKASSPSSQSNHLPSLNITTSVDAAALAAMTLPSCEMDMIMSTISKEDVMNENQITNDDRRKELKDEVERR
jgi:hypothetical protein